MSLQSDTQPKTVHIVKYNKKKCLRGVFSYRRCFFKLLFLALCMMAFFMLFKLGRRVSSIERGMRNCGKGHHYHEGQFHLENRVRSLEEETAALRRQNHDQKVLMNKLEMYNHDMGVRLARLELANRRQDSKQQDQSSERFDSEANQRGNSAHASQMFDRYNSLKNELNAQDRDIKNLEQLAHRYKTEFTNKISHLARDSLTHSDGISILKQQAQKYSDLVETLPEQVKLLNEKVEELENKYKEMDGASGKAQELFNKTSNWLTNEAKGLKTKLSQVKDGIVSNIADISKKVQQDITSFINSSKSKKAKEQQQEGQHEQKQEIKPQEKTTESHSQPETESKHSTGQYRHHHHNHKNHRNRHRKNTYEL